MNTSYLLSVLDLYLLKEKNGKMIVEVDNIENLVKVNFYYSFDHTNKTFVKLERNVFFASLKEFLNKFQENKEVILEDKVTDANNNETSRTFSLDGGRKITFVNFSKAEIKEIRSNFNNLKEEKEENTIFISDIEEDTSYNEIYEKNRKTRPAFSFGFTSYVTLFLTTIWILDILMIALLIFKLFIK